MILGEPGGAQHRGDDVNDITWFLGENASIEGAITVTLAGSSPSHA